MSTEVKIGAIDCTGQSLPGCRGETHNGELGEHWFGCLAGVWGYERNEWGEWVLIPPDPLTVPGSTWRYEGHGYVRPCERGFTIDDGQYHYLDRLPEGNYQVRIEVVREVSA
jgi:hypothetical protein